MNKVYVVYDLSDDGLRYEFSRGLIYHGLNRVQLSVFSGSMTDREKTGLVNYVKKVKLGNRDTVHILELCSRCSDKIIIHGEKPQQTRHLII